MLAPDAADCPASTRCYGVDSTNPFGEPDILVFRSTDGGSGWQQVGPDWTRSVLNDIACPVALTCYLAGTRGSIARITNGTTLAAQRSPTAREQFGIGCAGRAPATRWEMAAPSSPCGDPASAAGHEDLHGGVEATAPAAPAAGSKDEGERAPLIARLRRPEPASSCRARACRFPAPACVPPASR